MSVRCTPVRCQDQAPPPECSQVGFVTVTRPLDDNPCCLETLCGEPCAQCLGRAGVWQKRVVGTAALLVGQRAAGTTAGLLRRGDLSVALGHFKMRLVTSGLPRVAQGQ